LTTTKGLFLIDMKYTFLIDFAVKPKNATFLIN
jgi:hypothetical protein